MEVQTSFGNIETIGNAYRTDFDLSAHSEFSKKDFNVFLQSRGVKLVPHVFEVSMGVDRLFFAILEKCFREKDEQDETGNWKLGTEKAWEWFDFPAAIAPYEIAVFPLMRKDGHPEKAKELAAKLREHFDVLYQESGSIGKRYARADEVGCLYTLTVDYDTLKDDTVTIRYRNDGKQERIKIDECVAKIKENVANGRLSL
jgi:glycyl-tRNA synthetase